MSADGGAQMEKVTHTPTPWREGIGGNLRIYGPDNAGDDSGLLAVLKGTKAAADRAFIVRAVNCHDDLVAALKALTQDSRFSLAIGGNPNAVAAFVKQVDAVLAKAEGKPSPASVSEGSHER